MAGKMLASLRKETRERAAARERTRLEAESVEEAARLAGANNTRFAVYRRNPEGFIVDQLGGCLWSKQREIARSVVENRLTAVRSCHGPGKTALAARLGAWWLSVHEPGEAFLLTTAPTRTQVEALLWREINKVHAAGGLPGDVSMTRWRFGTELVGIGISPDDNNPAAGQGFHAPYLLAIADEACGVSKMLMDNFTSVASNDDSRMLAIGNPDDPATEFGMVCRPGSGWNVIGISAFDTPNFTGEEVPDYLRRVLVGPKWVEERRRRWGEDSPLWKSKVLGQFPEQSSDTLVPLAALDAARKRVIEPLPTDANDLGVDVARFGDDFTVIMHRRGCSVRRYVKESNRDTMQVVGMIIEAIRETGATRIKIDDIGLGGGVVDRLNELVREKALKQVEIVGVNVGEGATESPVSQGEEFFVQDNETTQEDRFLNLRAELNWKIRDRFIRGEVALAMTDPEADDLLAQASQIKYRVTSRGKIQIEPKADMKKRTRGVSPDDWDALVLAFADLHGRRAVIVTDDLMQWARRRA